MTPPAAGATGTLHTEYAYDANGNPNSRTDPNGHTTTWTHDLDGLLTSRTTDVGTWNYSHDKNGNLITTETPAGSSTGTVGDGSVSNGYDRMGRQTSTDYSDATADVSRTYDLAGRPATMVDSAGTVTYTLDNADRVTGIARTGGGSGLNGSFSYGYDDAGNITSRTLPDSSGSSYVFDDDGRLSTITTAAADTVLGYDAAGNLTSTTLPSGNGHVETRSYDRAGRLTTVESTKAPTILSKHLWTLDAAGNPTKTKTTRGAADVYDVYEYDTRNRLTNACYDLASTATNCSGATNAISYAYDKVSNRTQEVRAGSVGNTGTIDYAYNAADQLTGTTKSGVTTTYSYDANGNQAAIGGRSYSYDLAGRLASTTAASTTTSYGYDGDGRRISSSVGGGGADLRHVWDVVAPSDIAELALERDPSGTLVRRYLNGPTGSLNYTNASATFWYHHDPLNTVSDVTDASGTAQWRYEYEPYGATRTATNVSGSAPENRLRFNGQYSDTETGDLHLRMRQYQPSTGRFAALDPVENALTVPYGSAYGYAFGRPTVLVDPLGTWPDFVDEALEVVAGGADTLTFGASTRALEASGVDIDTDSNYFKAGQVAGSFVGPGGLAAAVTKQVVKKSASRLGSSRSERRRRRRGRRRLMPDPRRRHWRRMLREQAATRAVAAAAGGGLLGGLTRRCPTPAANALSRIAPASIRFGQSSVNGVEKIAASMSRKGWVGDPIDVVRMTDGGLTAIDNTRVLAARRAGIDVQATIHGHADPLPSEYISRFTTRRGGVASTWGEAIANRIGAQSAKYRDSYPNGSPVTGWGGG